MFSGSKPATILLGRTSTGAATRRVTIIDRSVCKPEPRLSYTLLLLTSETDTDTIYYFLQIVQLLLLVLDVC